MKPSDFYEKYWKINGGKPRPLTEDEKYFMDTALEDGYTALIFNYKRRPSQTVNLEKMARDMKKSLPNFFKDK